MTTLTSALDAEFVPAIGDFIVQCTGGTANLLRKNTAGAAFAVVGTLTGTALIVSNPAANAVYKFTKVGGNPVVQADQGA